ncbi:hypothetical protein ACE3G8_00110 [Vreelandella venusta]
MKVIQIVGPSYCGSTVLGYALNTVDGFFFGSEVRRHLKSFRDKSNGEYPSCDYCGEECKYWSKSFLDKTASTDLLQPIYDEFSSQYKEVEYFVDASKLLGSYKGTNPFARIVCVKHPLKLLASYLYNSRKGTFCDVEEYSKFKSLIDENKSEALEKSKIYFSSLMSTYNTFFSMKQDFFYFKTDEAHFDKLRVFSELLEFLECGGREIDVVNFSKYTCHSLGGNRAPVHLMKKKHNINVRSNERFQFYERTEGYGDWKIDNKYKELMSQGFISEIEKLPLYKECVAFLGYDE